MSEAPHPALPAFETLAARVDGAVLHLTLNRPEARNAMSLSMVTELRQTLAWAEASQAIRVVVLRGAGGHFCAGGDIKDMAAARARPAAAGEDAIASLSAQFGELCAAFAHSPLAVVAVLEGTVMGGGFGLACVADIAIAGENVAFRLPEVTLGLVPAQIAPYLALRIGASQARRLAISGARVGAAQALAIGLVHGVHAEAALDAALTCGVGVYVWSRSPPLAAVIMSAMVISMIAAGLAGALVPILLSRFGQDPATASSIILTTVTDVVGFFSFLGIATLFAPLLSAT